MTDKPLMPDITVELVGHDANAFSILAHCKRALIDHGAPEAVKKAFADEAMRAFADEAMRADYDHVLRTARKWFDVK